jgi:hypothetical protein
LEDVPEETRQWKPEIAPQAIVINRKGKIEGAPSGEKLKAGATISNAGRSAPGVNAAPPKKQAAKSPRTTNPRAERSWRLLM